MRLSSVILKFAALDEHMQLALDALVKDYAPDAPPGIVIMAAFGSAISEAVRRGQLNVVAEGLRLAEACILSGGNLADAVATGFLERLLAESSAGRLDFRRIAPLLGSASRKYCVAWDVFTGVRTPGL